MKKIYNKIAFYKIRDDFFRFFKNFFMFIFSPKYRYRRKNHMYSPKILMAQQFDKIAKFCEYANISYKDFFHIINTKIAGGNFYNYKNAKDFYADWKIEDTALNIYYQLAMYQEYYSYLHKYFGCKKIKYCDYGCGSATNSLSLYELSQFEEMHLYDVENESAKYIRNYIEKYNLKNVKWLNVEENFEINNYYDLIICSDVLEHLKNPTETLKKLHKMLKPKGYLLLAAPFEYRDNAEHIIEAPIDFYNNGGYSFLKTKFDEVHHFKNKIHISGLYQKRITQ